MERALYGVEVPYLHQGKVVHTARRFDERLTLGLLKMRYALPPEWGEPDSDASACEPDDFASLVERVASRAETWADA